MKSGLLATISFVAVTLPAVAGAQAPASVSWLSAGNGATNTRANLAESTITPATVGQLVPLWTFTASGEVPDTPTVQGTAAYAVDSGGSIYRLDATTGAVVWHVKLSSLSGNPMSTARSSPAITASTIIVGDQASATVYAISENDGTLVWQTKLDNARGAIITSSPVVVGNKILVGVASGQEELAATVKGFVPNFRGSVAELDLASGKLVWQTYTVPAGYTGGAVWGSNLAVDASRHAVFASSGDNYSVPASVAACQASHQTSGQVDRCLAKDDYIDSVFSLDLTTGAVNWARRMTVLDTWTVSCLPSSHLPATPCPSPAGLDYDFGSAPNLFSISTGGKSEDIVGAGQKSGIYWALDRDSGATVWATQVSPGGSRGGIQWGSAVGYGRVFVSASNSAYVASSIKGSSKLTNGGFWSALDMATGQILWQTPTTAKQPPSASHASRTTKPPSGASARTEGAVSVAGGVMYGSDGAGNLVALDVKSGAELWSYDAHGAAVDAPSVVNSVVYWGDGYGDIGRSGKTIYAFSLPK